MSRMTGREGSGRIGEGGGEWKDRGGEGSGRIGEVRGVEGE